MDRKKLLTLGFQIIIASALIWLFNATNGFEQAIIESAKETGSAIPGLSALALFVWLYTATCLGAFDFGDHRGVKIAVYLTGCVIALALVASAGISLVNTGHVGPTAGFCLVFAIPLVSWLWTQRKVLR